MFWNSMPVVVLRVQRGNTTHCHRRARAPIAIRAGSSLRNRLMICGAKTNPSTESTVSIAAEMLKV